MTPIVSPGISALSLWLDMTLSSNIASASATLLLREYTYLNIYWDLLLEENDIGCRFNLVPVRLTSCIQNVAYMYIPVTESHCNIHLHPIYIPTYICNILITFSEGLVLQYFLLSKVLFVFGLYENIRRSVHIEISGLLFTGLLLFAWLL